MMSNQAARSQSPAEKWLRENTITWVSPLPTHCLVGLNSPDYFGFEQDTADRPYMPYFFFEVREEGEITELEIVKSIRKEFLQELDENGKKGYEHLKSMREDLRKQAIDLANLIDTEFGSQNPRTGENTNVVVETERLIADLEEIEADSLEEAYNVDSEKRSWKVKEDVSTTIWIEVQLRNKFSEFAESVERPCVSVQEMGYGVGFSYLPADVPIEDILRLLCTYYNIIEPDASGLERTHDLLCHRIHILEYVLKEYHLYGAASEWKDSSIRKALEKDGAKGGRPKEIDTSALKEVFLDVLGKYSDCWHPENSQYDGVNFSGSAQKIRKEVKSKGSKYKENILRRPDGDMFSFGHVEDELRDIAKDIDQEKLDSLRDEAFD